MCFHRVFRWFLRIMRKKLKKKAPVSEDAGAFFFVFYGREGSSAATVSTLAVPGNISTATARTAS